MNAVLKSAAAVTALALMATAATAAGNDWQTSGHDLGGQRYSPLTQINKSNVSQLQIAWTYHMTPAGYAGRPRLVEAIPVVVGNSMYVTSSYGEVFALNATTGAELWKYKLPDTDSPTERGVAYWKGANGFPATVVFGSRIGRLYSLDAKTGKPTDGFGEHGIVNLKTPEVMGPYPNLPYGQPAVPIIYKNLIITGAGTPDAAPNIGPVGDTRAWDAKTGKLVWTFHTAPLPGTYGYDTWGGDSARHRSGVNVWGYFTVDEKRGILYMPLGAPNNDRVGMDRPGNNLFSSSIVAVDANTGKYLWHFQVTHHDIWDNDTPDPPRADGCAQGRQDHSGLADRQQECAGLYPGSRHRQADLRGRGTGGAAEPCARRRDISPTQPFPVKPEQLSQGTVSRDNLYKGEPEHQAYCEKMVDDNHMVLGSTYLPPGYNQITVAPPGTQGGVNYYGGSYNPKLHLFVANVNNLFQPMRVAKRPDGTFVNNYGVLPLLGPPKEAALRTHALGPAGRGECGHGRRGLSQDPGRDRQFSAAISGYWPSGPGRNHTDRFGPDLCGRHR